MVEVVSYLLVNEKAIHTGVRAYLRTILRQRESPFPSANFLTAQILAYTRQNAGQSTLRQRTTPKGESW